MFVHNRVPVLWTRRTSMRKRRRLRKCDDLTEQDLARAIDLNRDGLGPDEIAATLCCSSPTLCRFFNENNTPILRKRRKPGYPPKQSRVPLELLGKVPDAQLAKRHGVSNTLLYLMRRERGIPPFTNHARLSAEQIKLLGTCPDAVLAEKWGIPVNEVRYARRRRKIKSCNPRPIPESMRWPPEILAQLGKVQDSVIARALNVSGATVGKRRMSLAIPCAPFKRTSRARTARTSQPKNKNQRPKVHGPKSRPLRSIQETAERMEIPAADIARLRSLYQAGEYAE